jgi:hypothetical protein
VPPQVDRLRWGVLTGRAGGVRCDAAGFPRVLRGETGVRELNHLVGHVNPLGGLVTGRYDVHVDDPPPLAPTQATGEEPLPWSGMSGAAPLSICSDILHPSKYSIPKTARHLRHSCGSARAPWRSGC